MMLECPGTVRVFRPVTLSLEVHCEDVSELSVTVRQNTEKHTLILKHVLHYFSFEPTGLDAHMV